MHGQFLNRARALRVPQRAQHDAGDFALVGRMARRDRFRLDVIQVDIGLEQPQRLIEAALGSKWA